MKVYIGRYPKDHTKERKIRVEIHDYDTWNLDTTLAHIIWPALEKYLEVSKGIIVMDEPRDEYGGKSFEEAVTELIWVFKEIATSAEYQRIIDEHYTEKDINGADVTGWFKDADAMHAKHEVLETRIQNGLELFGKIYRHLWN